MIMCFIFACGNVMLMVHVSLCLLMNDIIHDSFQMIIILCLPFLLFLIIQLKLCLIYSDRWSLSFDANSFRIGKIVIDIIWLENLWSWSLSSWLIILSLKLCSFRFIMVREIKACAFRFFSSILDSWNRLEILIIHCLLFIITSSLIII